MLVHVFISLVSHPMHLNAEHLTKLMTCVLIAAHAVLIINTKRLVDKPQE